MRTYIVIKIDTILKSQYNESNLHYKLLCFLIYFCQYRDTYFDVVSI